MKRILYIIFISVLLIPSVLHAQGFLSQIKGKVVDKSSGEPLPGVNIQLIGTYLGTSSDINGEFTLKKIPLKTCSIKFTMIGYKAKEVLDIELELGETVTIPVVELESTVIGLNPVVVTASKQRQDLTVIPHSIAVVPEMELVERTPLRLDDALESVAGVHFIENHINIRGSSGYTRGVGSRVLLVVDEVPMMNSDNNEINWNILPVMDIEQIEVIKGAGSALYGSNALGGVVNVITKSPTDIARLKIRTISGVYTDPPYERWQWTNRTLNYTRNDINFSQSFGNLGVNVAMGYHKSTGFRTDGDFMRFNSSAKLNYRFPDASIVTLYGAYSRDNRSEFIEWQDQHNSLYSSPFYSGAKVKLNSLDAYFTYQKPITAKAGIKLRASFISSLSGDQYGRANDYSPAEGFGSEVKFDWLPHPDHNLTMGTELKIDGGQTKFIGDHRGFTISPYIQDQWQLWRRLTLTLGLRYDEYWLKDSDYGENHLNPKLGINYTPFAGTILRFSGGSGFRAASIFERYLDFKYKLFTAVPNEDLKAETSRSFDLGLHQQITNNWWVDAAVFNNDYFNYIEPVEEIMDDFTLQVQFRNVVRARIRGIELATKGYFWHNHLGFQGNITLMDAEDLNTGETLSYRPEVLSFITPSVRYDPFELQAEYRYASRIDKVMLYEYDQRVAQEVWSFRLYLRLDHFTSILALNNAFNYAYTQLERNLGEIRNVTITCMYEL
ncbi:TonB-dependent receptor [candidate division KSB1 bacterium]|nr:TonB-dependent receptor [candidate division KSB1 bacterium]